MNAAFEIDRIAGAVRSALEEDIGAGDITTSGIIPQDMVLEADIVVKDCGIVCGLPVADYIFTYLDNTARLTARVDEGTEVRPGSVAAHVKGPAQALLTGERMALNFLQRLSGIATTTSNFTRKARKYNTQIFDTRKTTPNWRYLERYAVRVGGGNNHRAGLYDQVLIKDNHLKCLGHKPDASDNTIAEATQLIRKAHDDKPIEVEVEDLHQLRQALDAGADVILLDNMDTGRIEQAVKAVRTYCNAPPRGGKRPLIEASGNVTLETVEDIARTGVDMISVGSLTHSVKALDISLEIR